MKFEGMEFESFESAVTGNFDGLTIGALHGAITITGTCVEHQFTITE